MFLKIKIEVRKWEVLYDIIVEFAMTRFIYGSCLTVVRQEKNRETEARLRRALKNLVPE